MNFMMHGWIGTDILSALDNINDNFIMINKSG